jgi:hypothetical protein
MHSNRSKQQTSPEQPDKAMWETFVNTVMNLKVPWTQRILDGVRNIVMFKIITHRNQNHACRVNFPATMEEDNVVGLCNTATNLQVLKRIEFLTRWETINCSVKILYDILIASHSSSMTIMRATPSRNNEAWHWSATQSWFSCAW